MKGKTTYLLILVAVAFLFGIIGFRAGFSVSSNFYTDILMTDVKEVRQGRMAGAFIALADNATLSEVWEEICSDVLRIAGESYNLD